MEGAARQYPPLRWAGIPWRVGTPTYKLSLVITRAERTREVAGQLQGFLQRRGGTLHMVLGSFDLAMLYPWESHADSLARDGTIPGIIGSTSVVFFPWVHSDQRCDFDPVLPPGQVRIISLVKLCPTLVGEHGLRAELRLLDAVRALGERLGSSVRIDLMGTMSWYECVLCITGADHRDLMRAYLSLCQEEWSPECRRPLVFHTHTWLCLPGGAVLAPGSAELGEILPPSMALGLDEGHAEDSLGRAACHVHVRTVVAASPSLVSALRRRFDSVDYCLGSTDLVCRPHPDTIWSQLIHDLVELRCEQVGVASTNLVVGFPGVHADREAPPVQQPSVERLWVNLEPRTIEALERLGEGIREGVTKSVYSFNAYIQDPVVSSAFLDLVAYVRALPELAEPVLEEHPSHYHRVNLLARTVHQFKRGFEQRVAGTFEAMDQLPTRFTTVNGAQNRTLLAIEGLVDSVITGPLARTWHGFATSSPTLSAFRSEAGVVECPRDRTTSIRALFPLLHEAVHCAEQQQPILGLDDEAFLALASRWVADPEDHVLHRRLSDIAADLFAVEYGLRGELAPYLDIVRAWLQDFHHDHVGLVQTLIRAACVFVGHTLIHAPPDPTGSPRETFHQLMASFWADLEPHVATEDRQMANKSLPPYLPMVNWLLWRMGLTPGARQPSGAGRLDIRPLPPLEGSVIDLDHTLPATLLAEAVVRPVQGSDTVVVLLSWWHRHVRTLYQRYNALPQGEGS